VQRPTFSPSVLVTSGHYTPQWEQLKPEDKHCWCTYNAEARAKGEPESPYRCERCHSFVTDGRIQFLADCTHALANQTVDLPDWTELDAPDAPPPPHRSELMSNAVLTIGYTDVPGFPPGSVVASILASIMNQNAGTPPETQTLPPGTVQATFGPLDPGDYSVLVQAVDANGSPLGGAATGSFNVPAPATVTLSLPTSVGAALS